MFCTQNVSVSIMDFVNFEGLELNILRGYASGFPSSNTLSNTGKLPSCTKCQNIKLKSNC